MSIIITRRIAKIDNTFLGVEDHGILTAMLRVDYGGSVQSIGGYSLDGPIHDIDGNFIGREGSAFGMEFIARVIRACGVSSWEQVKGRTIHVLFDSELFDAQPLGIENLPTEHGERFIFANLLSKMGEADDEI